MMSKKSAFRLSLLVLPIVVAASLFFSSQQPVRVEAGSTQIELQAPPCVGTTRDCASYPSAIASVLDSEAGISAYYQASTPVDLDDVRGLYLTIEIETSDYILGSMSVPDNWEDYDVHVYIHRSGWMLAYYLRDEPAVKIFDWQTYTGTMNPTRFQAVLNHVAASLSLPDPTLIYYDFRYPNATNLLLAAEDVQTKGTESFDILDTSFVYYERSWGLGIPHADCGYYCNNTSIYLLDSIEIHRIVGENITRFDTGFFSPAELSPDDPHTISVSGNMSGVMYMGALAIVYGPQP
jgi:hypothetical protein